MLRVDLVFVVNLVITGTVLRVFFCYSATYWWKWLKFGVFS